MTNMSGFDFPLSFLFESIEFKAKKETLGNGY